MLKGPQWTTLPAWPSDLYKKRKAVEAAAAAAAARAKAAAEAAAAGGALVEAPAVAPPDSPIGEELPYYVISSAGDLPEGAARPCTIVFAHNVVTKLKAIEAWIRACTAHALVSQLRAPPKGENVWRLYIRCACRQASSEVNEHGQGKDANGERDSVTGRTTCCPWGIVLQTTDDFGEDKPEFAGALKICVAKVITQHQGHLPLPAALQQATTLTPVEAAALKMITGPRGGNRFTNYSALSYLNSAPARKTTRLTPEQFKNIKRRLNLHRETTTSEDDVYELIASLMDAGAGFAIELRGANLQGALSSSAPSMIVRELDNPNKLYFIKDPATFEDTLDNWLRTKDGPELGEASDRYVRELQCSILFRGLLFYTVVGWCF